jgi:hypothetical protein
MRLIGEDADLQGLPAVEEAGLQPDRQHQDRVAG